MLRCTSTAVLSSLVLVLGVTSPTRVAAAECTEALQRHLLQITVNGVVLANDHVVVRDGCGRWYWPVSAKQALPLSASYSYPPPVQLAGKPYFLLSAIAEAVEFDRVNQQLVLTMAAERLSTNQIALSQSINNDPVTPHNLTGLFVDYDSFVSQDQQTRSMASQLTMKAFGPYGRFEQGLTLQHQNTNTTLASSATPRWFTRLNTTYSYENYNDMWILRVGDAISPAFESGVPISFAGVLLARDFSLRPGFIPYPRQTFRASAALPSVANVYVNNVLKYSGNVPPGPFELNQLPVVGADGNVSVQLRDTLGRVVSYDAPLLTLTQLLASGMWDYGLAAGFERENYGISSNRYGDSFVSGGYRYGLNDRITLDGRLEAMRKGGLIGSGFVSRLGTLGLLTLNGALSQRSDSGHGYQFMFGFQRASEKLSGGVQYVQNNVGYRQLGSLTGIDPTLQPLSTATAYLGASLGVLNVSLTQTKTCTTTGCQTTLNTNSALPLVYRSQLTVTLFRTHGDQQRANGLSIQLTIPLGDRHQLTANTTSQNQQQTSTGMGNSTRIGTRTLGYNYSGSSDAWIRSAQANWQDSATQQQLLATVQGDTRYTSWNIQANQSSSTGRALQVGATGSVVAVGEGIIPTRQIGEAFAVVSTSGEPNVNVLAENRVVARSNQQGIAVAPALYSYARNKISIEISQLPINKQVTVDKKIIVPQRGYGYWVDFSIEHSQPGRLIELRLPDDWQITNLSEVWLGGTAQKVFPLTAHRLYLKTAVAGEYQLRIDAQRHCHFLLVEKLLTSALNKVIGPLDCVVSSTKKD